MVKLRITTDGALQGEQVFSTESAAIIAAHCLPGVGELDAWAFDETAKAWSRTVDGHTCTLQIVEVKR